MKHDYFGSAKSDSEGYEELLTASRDRALQSAEILEAWVLTAGSLVDVVDIGLTLQDLGNSELSAGQKTLAVGGAALPIISGRVLTIGNKRCIPRDAPRGAARNVGESAKNWLGKDYGVITNKAGDRIFMSKDGLRKMRFDINNPHGDLPHIHLEVFKNGRWRDAIPGTHRIYPK